MYGVPNNIHSTSLCRRSSLHEPHVTSRNPIWGHVFSTFSTQPTCYVCYFVLLLHLISVFGCALPDQEIFVTGCTRKTCAPMAHGARDGLLHGQNKAYDGETLTLYTPNNMSYDKSSTSKIRQSTIKKSMSQCVGEFCAVVNKAARVDVLCDHTNS